MSFIEENNYAAKVSEVLEQPTPDLDSTSTITAAQHRYVVAERKLAAIRQIIKPLEELCEAAFAEVINESGIKATGKVSYFQDQFGVVHEIGEKEWTSVKNRPWAISHTRRPEFGEVKGTLSEKAAKEAGFSPAINKGEAVGA